MNKLTFELLCTEDFITDKNRQEGSILMQELHERRVSEAWEYVGEFSPFEIADTFFLSVLTIRHIENEKEIYYRGGKHGR